MNVTKARFTLFFNQSWVSRCSRFAVPSSVLAELGDITRFDSPRQLMAYLGLVPSEHSSGGSRRQGGITKTGNGHVRRVLVEAAWSYRFPARKTRIIEQRAEKTSASAPHLL